MGHPTMRLMAVLLAGSMAVLLAGCGEDDAGPPAVTPTTGAASIGVAQLFDGEGPRDAAVSGFVVWDVAGARLCEVLMESHPPQCGGMWIVVANPDGIDADLSEARDVRWSDLPVELEGRFDGRRFVLDATAEAAEPTDDDRDLVAAFLAHAAGPSASTAAAMPFADEVDLGLRDQIITTLGASERADPSQWVLDVPEFEGFAGPFSVLDVAAEPVFVTVGSHARCAAPPAPPPPDVAELRHVSIQPEEATSCLEWWTVDFYVDADGLVRVVTLDLFGP